MKSTPINAWPVAQDSDPVKQYPTAVDDPFKASLDKLVQTPFPTAAARDTANPTPINGATSWIVNRDRAERFITGKGWLPEGAGSSIGVGKPGTDFTGVPAGWSRLNLVSVNQRPNCPDFAINNGGVRTELAGSFDMTIAVMVDSTNTDLIIAYTLNSVASPPATGYLYRLRGPSMTGHGAHGHMRLTLAAGDIVYPWVSLGAGTQTIWAAFTYLSLDRRAHS